MADANGKKNDAQPIPPYLSYKSFINFVESLRKHLPARIDRSVMGYLNGTTQAHLLVALKYLDLISSEGVPTDKLSRLTSTAEGSPERQAALREILTTAYPFIFKSGVPLEQATSKQIDELFATTGAASETLRKSLAFFVVAAQQAGIKLSPHILKRPRRARGTVNRTRRASTPTNTASAEESTEDVKDEKSREVSDIKWRLLLEKFPTFDPAWSPEIQTKWFDAFERLSKASDEAE
jgi:hypothetical protein